MEWLALLIPIVSIPFMRILFPHRVTWWELFIPFLPVLIIIPLVSACSESVMTRDFERHGGWIVEARYYEDWDEWITQTCTRQYQCGTDSDGRPQYCTETYDCSYRDYHPEKWIAYGSNNEKIRIDKDFYNLIKSKFGNNVFVDQHRSYYSDDGDMYSSKWDNDDKTLTPVFSEYSYENRVQANRGIYEFKSLSEKEIKHLFQYPDLPNRFDDPPILGNHPQKSDANKLLQFHNAKMGAQYQLRLWLIIFKNEPFETGLNQESLWKGGNKNELVTCISIDDNNNPIWCNSFCWSPDGYAGNDVLKIEIKDFINDQKDLDLKKTIHFIADKSKKLWKRKHFEEFSYLDVDLPMVAIIIIFMATVIITVATCLFAIHNDINDHNNPQPIKIDFLKFKNDLMKRIKKWKLNK